MRRLREIAKQRARNVLIVSHDDRIREFVDRVCGWRTGCSNARARS
jgi:ABC-type lipoprotein export system ATPase subunit